MSNKSFSMTCDSAEMRDEPSPWVIATISPKLPQASLRVQVFVDVWDESVWRVNVATPNHLELINPASMAVLRPIGIDRPSGQVLLGDDPIPEVDQLSCSFKTL